MDFFFFFCNYRLIMYSSCTWLIYSTLKILFRERSKIHVNQFSSTAQSCLTLRPHGLQHASLLVHHQLLEFTQTHVHWVGDAIQPSHPLLSPSPPALSLSQHRGLFKWVSSFDQSIGVSASTSVLPMNTQDWSLLGWTSQKK